jgi:hypothetical protein
LSYVAQDVVFARERQHTRPDFRVSGVIQNDRCQLCSVCLHRIQRTLLAGGQKIVVPDSVLLVGEESNSLEFGEHQHLPSGKNSRNFHTLGYEMGNLQKLVLLHTQKVLFYFLKNNFIPYNIFSYLPKFVSYLEIFFHTFEHQFHSFDVRFIP